MLWKSFVAAIAAFALGSMAALYASGPPLGSGAVEAIEVSAKPIPLNRSDPAATAVGKLRYLGGLELRSGDRRFGGISGLMWEPDCKRLLAVTDSGAWIVLEPQEQGERLTGIAAAWIAPLLDGAGNAPKSKVDADAESLNRRGNEIFVWFEQDHRAQRYRGVTACRPDSLATPAHAVSIPASIRAWPANGGAEASAFAGQDAILLSETQAGPNGGRAAVRWNPETGNSSVFTYAAPANFSPTELAARNPQAANSPMLVLNRRASLLGGGLSAIVSEADLAGGTTGEIVRPREIARLQSPIAVDNMEGMAVRAEGDHRYIYLVSDNNFSRMQRSLLLKFELLD